MKGDLWRYPPRYGSIKEPGESELLAYRLERQQRYQERTPETLELQQSHDL